MPNTTVSRKQRLRTLENRIRKNAESIEKCGLQIGRDLIEIRDNELYLDLPGVKSWDQYIKAFAMELIGKESRRAFQLISAAEIEKRLPSDFSASACTEPTAMHMEQIGRLAETRTKADGSRGREKDYSTIKPSDVRRVVKEAKRISGKDTVSARDLQKAVDKDLGIDRVAKAAATKAKREEGVKLEDYIRQCIGTIEGIQGALEKVPAEGWTQLEEIDKGIAEKLAVACDSLADYLRS